MRLPRPSARIVNPRQDARQRVIRLARGVAAATIATFTALMFHLTGGGEMPGCLGIVVPLMFATLICIFLASPRASLPRLALSTIASQFLFHTLFVLGANSDPGQPLPQLSHHGTVIGQGVSWTAAAATEQAPQFDLTMWIGHAIAATLTVAALSAGDALLRCLLRISARVRGWWQKHLDLSRAPAGFFGDVPRATPRTVGVVARAPQLMPLLRRGPPPRPALSKSLF